MRVLLLAWAFVLGVWSGGARAAETLAAPPLEIVRQDIDLEVAANGEFWQSVETTYRPLTEAGLQAVRSFNFSYSVGYQRMMVERAFTLKKDGTRIPVPQNGVLYGRGQSSTPGYDDNRTITVYFSNVEIGDQVTIATATEQTVPWFPGVFAFNVPVFRGVIVHQATISLTAPSTMTLNIDAVGLEAGPVENGGGKTKRVWHFHNDVALKPEPGAVEDWDTGPHLGISTMTDYGAAARLHGDLYRDKVTVTPPIADLAKQLTAGISNRRDQAKALYDWVATHIKYVSIVLGASGFTPHKADDVLHNLYGDCKDHVILLQALLAAKGIKSSAVLIRAGTSDFDLPKAVSPFLFNHLITYIPEFQLFADSTAEYAPFGVLPLEDAGKTVLLTDPGKVAHTPIAHNTGMWSRTVLTVNPDGSADGDTEMSAAGPAAVSLRGMLATRSPDSDNDFFRAAFGTGSSGKFVSAGSGDLGDKFSYSAQYHIANFANLPGPGALGPQLGYKPFSFTELIGGTLPETRDNDYVCPSLTAEEDVTMTLPPNVALASLPPASDIVADQAAFHAVYDQPKPGTLHQTVKLTLDHSAATCSPAYFAKVHNALTRMQTALRAQILYK